MSPTQMRSLLFDTPAPIWLGQPSYQGMAHYIMRLPDSAALDDVARLIAGNQLAVSPGGMAAAILVPEGPHVSIHHSHPAVADLIFERTDHEGSPAMARILWVSDQAVILWGRLHGDARPAIWLIMPGGAERIMPLDHLMALHRYRFGVVCAGRCVGDDQLQLLTGSGAWPVQFDAEVTVLADGSLLVLEPLGPHRYAYLLNTDGQMKHFSLAPCHWDEVPVQVLRWGNRYFLAVRGSEGSFLREFGSEATKGSLETPIEGHVEAAWNAPGSKSIAVLTRIRTRRGWMRRLTYDGLVIHEGNFFMDPDDLYWSVNGKSLAAVVNDGTHGLHLGQQMIVGPGERFELLPTRHRVHELLVADSGEVIAKILRGASGDTPIIGGRIHTEVPYAWNLHGIPRGVGYNSVHDRYLMYWMDETDVHER